MELHLIRHADAEPPRDGLLDSDRRLTDKGHRQTETLREVLKRLEVRYARIIASPLERAQQTASGLERLGNAMETSELLAMPPGPDLLARLRELEPAAQNPVALVGHQPYLSELVALLLFGNAAAADRFEFKKSGLYALCWPDQPALQFVLTPGVAKKLTD